MINFYLNKCIFILVKPNKNVLFLNENRIIQG